MSPSEQFENIYQAVAANLIKHSKISDPESPFEESPVSIDTFINSPDYLNIGSVTYPIVQYDLSQVFSGKYKEAVLLEGIGGGKSTFASIAIAYMTYLTLILRNPIEYYQLIPGSKIAFMNMSTSSTQAKKIVFGRISTIIKNSKWFQLHYLPDPKTSSELKFAKDVSILPGSSSETAPLGYDILGAVMDEAAFMVESKHSGIVGLDDQVHNAAEEIYNSMVRRIESRFANAAVNGFKGLMIIISSPRWKGDFICKKYEEAKGNPEIYARRRSTFDCKPRSFYCGQRFIVNVEKKSILLGDDNNPLIISNDKDRYYNNDKNLLTIPAESLKSFQRNMTKALRDICAIASRAVMPYITNYAFWKETAENSGLQNPYANGRFESWFRGNGMSATVHVDLGTGKEGRDACGIAMACKLPGSTKIAVPFMLQLRAGETGVDFQQVREIIETLKQLGFNIALVSYDGWQSIGERQMLEKKGFKTEELSIDRTMEPYETLKESVNMGKVVLLNYQPFLDEVEGLELVEGKKVDHAPENSKDVADSVAGCVFTIMTRPINNFSAWTNAV